MNLDLQADVISSVLLDITDDESIVRGQNRKDRLRHLYYRYKGWCDATGALLGSWGLDGNLKLKREA